MTTSVSSTSARLPSAMSRIVVSPSTGTRALGSVSVYGRSRRPAPAASTSPIMGVILRLQRCRPPRIAVRSEAQHAQDGEPVLGDAPDHPVVDLPVLVQDGQLVRSE